MSGNNTRARGYSPIRSYRANEKTGRAERHTREACLVRRESVRVARYQAVIRACLVRRESVRVARYQAVIRACLTARPYVSCCRNDLFH